MNIASLQTFLRSQAAFLTAADAPKKLVADLTAFADSLTPFADHGIDKIADLLHHAAHHRDQGEWLPLLTGKKPATKKPAAPKASPDDLIREATQRLAALYERALDPDFRFETVDAEIETLGKTKALTIPHLTTIARDFGLSNIPKKKPDLLAALGRKIKSRREFHDRTQVGGEVIPETRPAVEAAL